MKKCLPVITVVIETVVILLLAVLLLNPAEKKDLSQLSEEKQIEYLHSEGVNFDEEYNAYALMMIKNYERNPEYEIDVFLPYYLKFPETTTLAIRDAVNKYYGRDTEAAK